MNEGPHSLRAKQKKTPTFDKKDDFLRCKYLGWFPYTTRKFSHFEPQVIEVPAVTIIGECFFVVSVYYKTAREIRFCFPQCQKKTNVSSYKDIYYSKNNMLTSWSLKLFASAAKEKAATLTSMHNVNKHIHHQQSTLQFFQRISWQLPG